nr:hypothetical protein [Tanacetum cinerariifolium]
MNYYEPNPCYNYSGFDNFQPSQPVIDHLNLQQRINDSMIELHGTFQAWLQQRKDQACQKIPICYDDDDDEDRDQGHSHHGDEHLDTIPGKEPDDFIKSSVENLVPNPSESEDEHSSIISSSKIDSLLDEFAGELILLKSIPSRIDEADCDPKEEIRLIEKLLYDNSSPRPLKVFNFENSNATIESFSPSPIPVEDSDSLMEEIDSSLTPDDSMPPDIKEDDYYSEGDILILK